MSRPTAPRHDAVAKTALVGGFLAVGAATLIAHTSPATGYEVSLYRMTPTPVWAGLGLAVAISLLVAVWTVRRGSRLVRTAALILGGAAMTVLAGLPIIRGYQYNGQNDSLTHLGWATAIGEQSLSPFELFYPGIHTASVLIESTIGISLSHAMLVLTLVSVVAFFVFVPLAVHTIQPTRAALVAGVFASFLLLPITTLSTHMHPHAMSQTVLLSALLVYVLVKYLRTDRVSGQWTAFGSLFAIVSATFVVFHPQFAAHMIVVLLGISGIQFVASRLGTDRRMLMSQSLSAQTALFSGVFAIWMLNNQSLAGFARDAVGSAVLFLLGDRSGAGESIAAQGASVTAIGGSLRGVFLRMFVPELLFSLLAAGLFLAAIVRWPAIQQRVASMGIAFGIALVGLFAVFFIYFFGDTSEMYFRVFGLMMVFVTILGALALRPLIDPEVGGATPGRNTVFSVGIGILLVLSLVAAFPSPFIYNQSHHVSDGERSGYEQAYEHAGDDLTFLGIRDAPNRYDDAINANHERTSAHGTLNETVTERGFSALYDQDTYVTISQSDRDRETIAYQEIRYTDEDFDTITGQDEMNRVQTNGELDVYLVRVDG